MTDRPHRPVPFADLTALIDAARGGDEMSRAEVASATAALVIAVGRGADRGALTDLDERVGLDTLAALWRDADPVSLPGALWVLYVVRQWCSQHAVEVTRLWRTGAMWRPADALVAGVADDADAGGIRAMADAILTGAYRGDFAVALERAAAIFRVVAAGRRDDEDDPRAVALAARNEQAAADLTRAARLWRNGALH